MATATKEAFGAALKQMMNIKPMDRITVKDLVEICKVNRQTFYYHFDDVYDLLEWIFEQDAESVLPEQMSAENWKTDFMSFFNYLQENRTFVINVYNSNSRLYMLRFFKTKLDFYIRSYVDTVAYGKNLERNDYEFIIDFYSSCIVGAISQWLDLGMNLPPNFTVQRLLLAVSNNIERLVDKFEVK